MSAQYSCSTYTKNSFKGIKDKHSANPQQDLDNALLVPELKQNLHCIVRTIQELEDKCTKTIKQNHSHTRFLPDHAMPVWWDKYSNEISEYLTEIRKCNAQKHELQFKIQEYEIPPTRVAALRNQLQIKEKEKEAKEREEKKTKKVKKVKKEKAEEKEKKEKEEKAVPDNWEDLA